MPKGRLTESASDSSAPADYEHGRAVESIAYTPARLNRDSAERSSDVMPSAGDRSTVTDQRRSQPGGPSAQ